MTTIPSSWSAEMCQNLLELMRDMARIKKLNNRELVSEIRDLDISDNLLVQEMMTRLWPDWDIDHEREVS